VIRIGYCSYINLLTQAPENASEHYNYFRDYDPTIGRYIESDPIGMFGGPNTFACNAGSAAEAEPERPKDWNGNTQSKIPLSGKINEEALSVRVGERIARYI
jgi:RHS repeat-associated protein